MFEGFTAETIDFLWGIRFNNERSWFQEHKAEYEKHLYRPMLALAQAVKERYSLEGTILKPSRIYRDVRYAKVPYKDYLWFVFREDNTFWSEHPSLYFQIQPEGGSLGFILYSPKAHLMELHRKRMLEKPEEFSKIITPILADERFSDQSTRYKRPKEGGAPELEPWYQLKNCFVEQSIPVGEELFDPNLPEKLADAFQTLELLYHYFRKLEVME
jgi:uncharacterized protein (TIGR02453 family)